jgi:pyrroline-5-carboxylate reductase
MIETTPIGIIGGSGWMGRAMGTAFISRGHVGAADLWVSNRSGRAAGYGDCPGVRFTADNRELAAACRTVVLSVLPRDFPAAAADLSGHLADRLVISVMAGASMARIAELTGARRIVRIMPNTPAEIWRSYTPWVAGEDVGEDECAFVQSLLDSFGAADRAPDEAAFEYLAAMTGAGIGLVSHAADCVIQAAIAHGIDPALAEKAGRGLFESGGALLAEQGRSPGDLTRELLNYGGVTAEVIKALRAGSLADDTVHAFDAAVAKAARDMTRG